MWVPWSLAVNIQNSTLYRNFKEPLKLGHSLDHCSITSASDFGK